MSIRITFEVSLVVLTALLVALVAAVVLGRAVRQLGERRPTMRNVERARRIGLECAMRADDATPPSAPSWGWCRGSLSLTALIISWRAPSTLWVGLRDPSSGQWRNPDLFWPDDRRWFVATDVDFWSLFVGGDDDFITELTRSVVTPTEIVALAYQLESED